MPGTLRVISARLDYWPLAQPVTQSADGSRRTCRAALGRDYHKVLRSEAAEGGDRIEQDIGAFRYRVFTDSAPVLEVGLR